MEQSQYKRHLTKVVDWKLVRCVLTVLTIIQEYTEYRVLPSQILYSNNRKEKDSIR